MQTKPKRNRKLENKKSKQSLPNRKTMNGMKEMRNTEMKKKKKNKSNGFGYWRHYEQKIREC